MPDDVIKTTVGEVAVELARRGLDPDSPVTVTIPGHEIGTGLTGAALIAALQASPYRDIDIEPPRERLPVRDVNL